jgi:membrane-bound metal-dependent hydrolase YbcI (DUF457 family)
MANAKTHILIAGAAGVAAYAVYCRYQGREFKLVDALGSAAIAVVGGIAPDVVEPALHPNHRSLFHSVTGGAALVQSARGAWRSTTLPAETKFVLVLLLIGYVSHLLADAATPKGLPILC